MLRHHARVHVEIEEPPQTRRQGSQDRSERGGELDPKHPAGRRRTHRDASRMTMESDAPAVSPAGVHRLDPRYGARGQVAEQAAPVERVAVGQRQADGRAVKPVFLE